MFANCNAITDIELYYEDEKNVMARVYSNFIVNKQSNMFADSSLSSLKLAGDIWNYVPYDEIHDFKKLNKIIITDVNDWIDLPSGTWQASDASMKNYQKTYSGKVPFAEAESGTYTKISDAEVTPTPSA